MTREDFLAERMTGFGGSDASSLLNEGYGCARRLWYEKVGFVPDYEREENRFMRLGKVLEPYFRGEYAVASGRSVRTVDVLRAPDHPFMLVHLDGIVTDPERELGGALELKAFGDAMFRKMRREGLSVDYICQLQWGMMIGDGETPFFWGSFGIGSRSTGEIKYWDHEPNTDIQQELVARAKELWAKVLIGRNSLAANTGWDGIAPNRLDPDEERCRRCEYRERCQGGAVSAWASGTKTDATPAPELLPIYSELQSRKALLVEAKELVDEVEEKLKDTLGEREAVLVPYMGKMRAVYFRKSAPEHWQPKELARAYDELRETYLQALTSSGLNPALVEQARNKIPGAASFKEPRPQRSLRVY